MCRCNISFDRRLDGAHCSVWTHTEWWWIPLFFHLHYRLIGSCYIVVFSCSCIVKPSGVPSIIMWRSYLVFASRGWESTSIMEQVIQIIICWLKFALSKKNIKLVLAQRIYIRKSPIPVQLQPLHYVKIYRCTVSLPPRVKWLELIISGLPNYQRPIVACSFCEFDHFNQLKSCECPDFAEMIIILISFT